MTLRDEKHTNLRFMTMRILRDLCKLHLQYFFDCWNTSPKLAWAHMPRVPTVPSERSMSEVEGFFESLVFNTAFPGGKSILSPHECCLASCSSQVSRNIHEMGRNASDNMRALVDKTVCDLCGLVNFEAARLIALQFVLCSDTRLIRKRPLEKSYPETPNNTNNFFVLIASNNNSNLSVPSTKQHQRPHSTSRSLK